MLAIFNGKDWINPETNEIYEPIIYWFTGAEWRRGTVKEWSDWRKTL